MLPPGLNPSSLAQNPRPAEVNGAEIRSTGVLPTKPLGRRNGVRAGWQLAAVWGALARMDCRELSGSTVPTGSSDSSQGFKDRRLVMGSSLSA